MSKQWIALLVMLALLLGLSGSEKALSQSDEPEREGQVPEPNDQVIGDDLIVTGSMCLGFDCADGEVFNADTLRLEETILRIHFEDSSNTGVHPTNDWRILINDQGVDGRDYFAIEDATAVQIPFRIMAGAPANALYIDPNGRIGLGTAAPASDLHLLTGDSPRIRLEQDASQGLGAQGWDLIGNDYSFFIRDVTTFDNPFSIRAGAPDHALFVDTSGYVGIGTNSPETNLHLQSGDTPAIRFNQDDSLGLPAQAWDLGGNELGFFLRDGLTFQYPFFIASGAPANSVYVGDNGYVGIGTEDPAQQMHVAGHLLVDGNIYEHSDVEVKENFVFVDGRSVLERLVEMPISSWNYRNDDPAVRHIGPTAQDFYEAFGLGADNRYIAPLDTNGVAMAAIQGLHQTVVAQEARINDLEQQNAELEERLQALEAMIKALTDE